MRGAGADNARLDARLLLAHALGCSSEALLADAGEPLTNAEAARFEVFLARREKFEPVARIIGRRDFWTICLSVGPATLVPRPDSETLIEAALDCVGPDTRGQARRILDLGTGTGCLLLAVLTEFPAAFGVGVDLSEDAARVAAANARALGLSGRAAFVTGDWAACLSGRFDLILSNPPYIASDEIAGLMPDVARHDPLLALDGGADGMAAYRLITADLDRLLAPGGVAILELGAGQAASVGGLARRAGLRAEFRRDLAGIDRAAILRRASG